MTEPHQQSDLLQSVYAAAVKEAHQLELDALPSEEELAGTLSFTPKFGERMAVLFKKAARDRKARRLPLCLRRVAVVAMTVFSTVCAALFLTPEVRASVRHIAMEWFDTYASFTFNPEEEAFDGVWKANYLPKGFALAEDYSSERFQIQEFDNAAGERILLQCMPADGASMSLDNEHSTHIIIQLDSGEGHLFEGFEGYPTMLLWERRGTSFLLTSDLKNNAEILRMAENLEPVASDSPRG